MNKLTKSIIIFLIFLGIALKANAQQIGVWENSNNAYNPALIYKSQMGKPSQITKQSLNTLSAEQYPVLIFTKYQNLDEYAFNTLKYYIKYGGKLILVTPLTQGDDANFKKLASLIGINVEKIIDLPNSTEINWVEKTLTNNSLINGARLSKINMTENVSHLAVFGDIEKHESAITLSPYGVVLSWCWGIDGDKTFNDKSMFYILNELLKKNINTQPKKQKEDKQELTASPMFFDYKEEIQKLREDRNIIENNQDIILNYTMDMTLAQQNLERSKVNELWALYHAQKGENSLYKKYYNLAEKSTHLATLNLNQKENNETRGIWFDRGTIVNIKNKAEMGRYFEKLKNSGINTVYFETLNAGYTIYPSKIGTQNPLTKGKDPLKWAIEEAHMRKIKLHAWVWAFAVGNDRHNKIIDKKHDYAGPVLEKNSKWALLSPTGKLRPKNQPEFWIDPSNKEGVDYLLSIIDEIIQNYEVDGIQLDYIRYPFQSSDNLMGFNHNSTEQFTSNTGEKMYTNNYPTNTMINKWKESNINNFVRKTYHNAKEKNENLKISASIFSKSQESRLASIQQNYENWIAGNYIDFLTPMSYSTSIKGLESNLAPLKTQTECSLIYPGIALKHVDSVDLLEQITTIRENGFAGVSFFAIEQLDDEKIDFLSVADFSLAENDPTYSPAKTATNMMANYKTTLNTIKTNYYELKSAQKIELDNMIAYANAVILKTNNNQLTSAITTLKELEEKNEKFFKDLFNYNKVRKQAIKSYLKRAKNLLKIANKI